MRSRKGARETRLRALSNLETALMWKISRDFFEQKISAKFSDREVRTDRMMQQE
jgi:hypothetical protein